MTSVQAHNYVAPTRFTGDALILRKRASPYAINNVDNDVPKHDKQIM